MEVKQQKEQIKIKIINQQEREKLYSPNINQTNNSNNKNNKINNKNNYIKIYQQNIQGLASKQPLIEQNLKENKYPHIGLLQECTKSINSAENINILATHYISHKNQTGRAVIIVRNEILSKQVKIQANNINMYQEYGYETIWVEIQLNKTIKILFGSVYRNPIKNINEFNYKQFEQEIIKAKQLYNNIIIGGDFNAYNQVWGCNKQDKI